MKNKNLTFTVIHHGARLKFELSLNAYCVADTIYHLSNNPKNTMGGWCYKSKENIGAQLGLSKQTVHRIINLLIKEGLVVKNESSLLKTTSLWYEVVVQGSKNYLPSVNKEINKQPSNVSPDGNKTLHNNNINKDSDKGFSVEKLLPSSIKKLDRQTLVVLQRFVDIYNAEYQDYPALGIKEVKCVKQVLKKLGEKDALQLLEDWFDSPKVSNEVRPILLVAFSNSAITRWRAMEL